MKPIPKKTHDARKTFLGSRESMHHSWLDRIRVRNRQDGRAVLIAEFQNNPVYRRHSLPVAF